MHIRHHIKGHFKAVIVIEWPKSAGLSSIALKDMASTLISAMGYKPIEYYFRTTRNTGQRQVILTYKA